MKKLIVLLTSLMALALAGCVSTANVAVPKARLAQAAGASVAATRRPLPDFADFKPSNAMFGAIGGLASVSSGNDLIRKLGVPDPAAQIAKDLGDHMATTYHVVAQSETPISVSGSDTKEIATAAAGKSDLVLDIQTVNWSCVYLPLKWTRYRVIYTVKLRLIDVKKQELVAEGFFAWKTPDDAQAVSYDELWADGARVLREQLGQASKAATEYFKTTILNDKG